MKNKRFIRKREVNGLKAVFLDRDGVLNESVINGDKPSPPKGLTQLQICEGAPDACIDLKRAGFVLIVVTNQPDVARGTQRREVVEAMNRELTRLMPIDEFCICYHDDDDNCDCRKPKPGLLVAAAQKWSIDLRRSFMVGDRWRDIDAGIAVGCRTVFIDRQYKERKPAHFDFAAKSLRSATNWIIKMGSD
jgi:D-glycero-D-manno-heptose 1,7-bisphosphate phosphatase